MSEKDWVPCDERMPTRDDTFLVSGEWSDGKKSVGECTFSTDDGYFLASWMFTVEAWMEKPKPYRKSDE